MFQIKLCNVGFLFRIFSLINKQNAYFVFVCRIFFSYIFVMHCKTTEKFHILAFHINKADMQGRMISE